MATTTQELIVKSYYLAGIVAKEFETVSGPQKADGLDALNDILGEKTTDNSMIPYHTKYALSAIAGTEEYYVADLIDVSTLTFTIDNVRYSTRPTKRDKYFGSNRANDITSLPFSWHLEREFGGARVFLYYLPDQAYSLELMSLFRLSAVTAFQDLDLTIDKFYQSYLRYALAERLCDEFGFTTPPNVEKKIEEFRLQISKRSTVLDLSMKKISTLTSKVSNNYGLANLSTGWLP